MLLFRGIFHTGKQRLIRTLPSTLRIHAKPTVISRPFSTKTNESFAKEFEFLKTAERLKTEMRHSWLSDGKRQESVAEHSWRLALMVMRYADKLDKPVNIEKCLKFATIHDLAEAKAGDIPVFSCQTTVGKKTKYEKEHQAMLEIKQSLNDKQGEDLYQLWLEYEKQESYESKFVKALDKLEATIQHNEAPLHTWIHHEKVMLFQDKWVTDHCKFDSFLSTLCRAVIKQGINKLKMAGEDMEKIKQDAQRDGNTQTNNPSHTPKIN